MNEKRLFPTRLYLRKFLNTFVPRIIFRLSPNRYWAQRHWGSQNKGDIHGFDNYCADRPTVAIIIPEIQHLVEKDAAILDLGCNCGYYLSRLNSGGYTHLTGIDICGNAIAYGKENLGISDAEMITGSFEDVLPELSKNNRAFKLVYTVGATIELVHPSFDIIKYICAISSKYVVIIISLWGYSYPRFWEYEFNRNGFILVKCVTPEDGNAETINDPTLIHSLLVFKKIK